MTTIKAYTDLEQSRKLAKILPLESADMHYVLTDSRQETYGPELGKYYGVLPSIPCWSLATLLDILNKTAYSIDEESSIDLGNYQNEGWSLYLTNAGIGEFTSDNPVDACYEMILKLHELKML